MAWGCRGISTIASCLDFVWVCRGLRGFAVGGLRGGCSLGGFGEHLDYLFEGGSVCLDKGSQVRVGRFGSGDGFCCLAWK